MKYNTNMKPFISFILFFIFVFYLIYLTNTYSVTQTVEKFENTCGAKCTNNGKKLLPIMNPKYNLREICKNCILLEDHLFQKGKRCEDCIKKHFLTIEALAEEAITLDKKNECREYYDLPDKIRELEKQYIDGKEHNAVAQQLRQIRKGMMQKCFAEFR